MTGAAVPDGADAIVMLEMTDRLTDDTIGGEVAVRKRMAAGDNITPVGFEAFHGERVLEAGTVIRPGEAALLATFGYAEVSVHRPPRVAIFPTGSELLSVKDPIAPGKIRNSNGYMLAAQIRECGGEPILMPPLPDWVDEVKEALEQAFEFADVIVTTGGVSVGDKDVLVDYFSGWDGELLFNKVAMRPGSPTTAGVRRDKLLFSLSGNPGAAFVGFELFAAPYVRRLLGQTERPDRVCSGTLEFDYAKGSAYPRYVRGTMSCRDGRLFVTPAGVDKSSIMMTIKDADCLICIPAGGRGAAYGELVRVIRL
jgi:molybdopterin molybdotransferase